MHPQRNEHTKNSKQSEWNRVGESEELIRKGNYIPTNLVSDSHHTRTVCTTVKNTGNGNHIHSAKPHTLFFVHEAMRLHITWCLPSEKKLKADNFSKFVAK